MFDPLIVALSGFVVFSASVITGLTGFGFTLFSVPLLMLIISPKMVIPLVSILSALNKAAILFEARKWVELKKIWPLMTASVVGMFFGTSLLMLLDIIVLKLFIGIVITFFAIAFLLGFRKEIQNERLVFIPIGLISGFLGGSTSISGPPVVLFFSNQEVKKEVFRANLIAYFLVLYAATISAYGFGGLITREIINYVILFIPVIIIGAIMGIKLAHKVDERVFRNITLIIVVITGLFSIISNLAIL